MPPVSAPRQYALAAFAMATEPLVEALRVVAERLEGDPALRSDLEEGDRDLASRHAEIVALLPSGSPDAAGRLLGTMLERGDLQGLPGVVGHLDAMATFGPAAQVAVVTTTLPVGPAERDAFGKSLRARYGEDIGLVFETDPGLLGGVTVRIGDQIIDGSVATKLSSLGESLLTPR